jgi:3-isopropylmalate/(R)-2-methylmalate dehydratase small subunit
MNWIIKGRAWKFGDNIDTDTIIPSKYLILPINELKRHVMEPLDPEFYKKLKPGDIIVAGNNFGCGSSREQAPAALKALDVSAIIAESFARIFFRNAISIGLPVFVCKGISKVVKNGDLLEVDIENRLLRIMGSEQTYIIEKPSKQMIEILKAGGIIQWLQKRSK